MIKHVLCGLELTGGYLMYTIYIIGFLIALAISYTLTPYAKKLAYRIGAIDVPEDNRRVHKKPVPRLGGLAIYVAFVATSVLIVLLDKSFQSIIGRDFIGIFLGATMIVAIGILDDTKQISAKLKLTVQVLAAVVAIYFGVRIEFISNVFGKSAGTTGLGMFSIPLTLFWIVGITNTVNLIDGLDGLAAGVAAIASVSLGVVAYLNGMYPVALLLFILAGAALGFLPYNFNPAKIFMGDTGSLLIGFLLATISIEGVIKTATTIAVAIPVLALGVPIFDTAFAILRRVINKRPIMEADKSHLHHRLLARGLTQKQTVLTLYSVSIFLGASAIFISDSKQTTAYLVIFTIGVAILSGVYLFGLVKRSEERKANL